MDKNIEITKLFKDTFNTPSGKKCLAKLKEVFLNRSMYQKGQTFEETAYRQGQADIVKQIIDEVNSNG